MSDVSVVIPVRDDAAELERCLRALARQTVAPVEVVVVDNMSTDESAQVARRHGARVVVEPQVGIPTAAATGYDAAVGSIIARLDADTLPGTDWVERIVDAFDARPAAVAITGVGIFRDGPRGLRLLLSLLYLGSYYLAGAAAAGHHVLWGSCMAVRSDAWQRVSDRVHRHHLDIHDDMDLSFVLGPAARIVLLPSIRVGVSIRSLRGRHQRRRRLSRGLRTVRLNWLDAPPWQRWAVTVRRIQRGPARRPTHPGPSSSPDP